MPTAMTFNSLVSDVQAYLERGYPQDTTVAAQIPNLINLAEREIAQRLKILGFITPMISTLVANTPVYQKPDRWRRTASMNYALTNSRTPIYARSLEYCQRYWPDQTLTGPPKFYADYDYQHWLIVPTPAVNYNWAINAWLLPALLDAVNQSNWLTEFAPNVLLYRTLLECTPFLKNDERIPVWERMYEEQIAGLNGQDIQRMIDRAGVRKED